MKLILLYNIMFNTYIHFHVHVKNKWQKIKNNYNYSTHFLKMSFFPLFFLLVICPAA